MSDSSRADDALSRRRFVALAGLVPMAAAALGPSLLAGAESSSAFPMTANPSAKKIPIGLELYAVHTELARDLPNTLQQVARMGYDAVEFYSPYFDWTPAYARDVRRQIDGLGLRCLSTHNHHGAFTPGAGLAKAVELNQILGARQVVLGSTPPGIVGAEGWKRFAAQLTAAAGQLGTHGLLAGYHNHEKEWARLDGGERPMDLLAANTPEEFVLQLDVGTCVEAGEDPVAWIRAHPGRIRSVHLKDWAPGTEADEKQFRVLFGEGVSPWRAILDAAEAVGGVEIYLMEQEGSRFSEFESVDRCLAAWRRLRGVST